MAGGASKGRWTELKANPSELVRRVPFCPHTNWETELEQLATARRLFVVELGTCVIVVELQ